MHGVGAAWSRPFLPGAGVDPIWREPETPLGPRTPGARAAEQSGSSATLAVSKTTSSPYLSSLDKSGLILRLFHLAHLKTNKFSRQNRFSLQNRFMFQNKTEFKTWQNGGH